MTRSADNSAESWQDTDWVVREYEAGRTALEIARESREWYSLIARTLRREGYDPGPPPWLDESKLHELHVERGLSPKVIAGKYQTNPSSIRLALRKYGMEPDPSFDPDELRALYENEDVTWREAADELDTTEQTYRIQLKKYGIL